MPTANRTLLGVLVLACGAVLASPLARPASALEKTGQARTAIAPLVIAGEVLGPDGAPVDGAFIHLSDGVSSAITGSTGKFELTPDSGEGGRLVVTAVGFQTAEVPLARWSVVHLVPQPSYQPAIVPPPSPFEIGGSHVFDTQIAGAYRLRYQSLAANGRGVQGWANNEYAIAARYRAGNVVLGLEGYRLRAPLTLSGASVQPSSTPEVEQDAWNLSLGYDFEAIGLEILPELVFANDYFVPTNGGTPWTGTPLDFDQTRTAGVVGLEIGRRLGPLVAALHGQTSIAENTTLLGAPYAATNARLSEVGLDLGYTIFPGLRADLTYARTLATGTQLDEWADVLGLGLTYLPAQVQP
ncbi:MAG: hypothetical protein KGR26_03795 [Cyanobacteria bacterium REEB65]|nr:hypothetical protein [Cyanobacteria bacterium REEB65]